MSVAHDSAAGPVRVRISAPTWSLNGVNVFSERLVRGLCAAGCDARIVLTAAWQPDPKPLPLAADLPVDRLGVGGFATRGRRWRSLQRYLTDQAPCVYLPNYDVHHSALIPTLPASIAVLGIVHSDDPQHYEHAERLGAWWDAVVAVSPRIASELAQRSPGLAPRLRTIPYGIEIPDRPPSPRPDDGADLRIVYAGRLVEEQKRVLDLARLAGALARRGVPFRLVVVGDGPARPALGRRFAEAGVADRVDLRGVLPNAAMRELFAGSDATVLLSAYEGLPIGVLEAMAVGCVPVVTDVASGVRDLVQDGETGFRVAVGDTEAAAERLARLHHDRGLANRIGEQAWRRVREGGYDSARMVERYLDLATRLLEGGLDPGWRRTPGPALPPPEESWKDTLPPHLRTLAMQLKKRLRGGSGA